MILKLCNPGSTRYVECNEVLEQLIANGLIDIEAATERGPSKRFLIGQGPDAQFERAYVMERGKTVDSIVAPKHGVTARLTVNGEDD